MWAADDAKFWNLGKGNFVPLSLPADVLSSFFFFKMEVVGSIACVSHCFLHLTTCVCFKYFNGRWSLFRKATPGTRELEAFFGWRLFCTERNNFTEEGVHISCSKHSIVCPRSNSGTCIPTGNCLFLTPGNLGRALGAPFCRFWEHGLVVPLGLVAEFFISFRNSFLHAMPSTRLHVTHCFKH